MDPSSGELLTQRAPTSYRHGEKQPDHYLNYFHAQLVVSPESCWIADNGWVWHPWGIIRSWSLASWLQHNPWESEDGESVRSIAERAYFWDGPICWIDDSTLAVWGWGEDEQWLLPAVRLIDVCSGKQIRWFPGPRVRQPAAWPPKKLAPSLFFDRYLFAVDDDQGTSVWDVVSGERLLCDQKMSPVHYHPRSKEFLSLGDSELTLSCLEVE